MSVTDVEEKERLIQTNQKHYSEMIGLEQAPSDVHQRLYARALLQNGARMASEVQSLALALNAACTGPGIALVSFVRAGLPLGVLLRRALVEMGRDARHYGISIIRDRGIDTVALEAIIRLHGAENIVFVDGWTGKGAISGELARTLADDTRFPAGPRLVVLADPRPRVAGCLRARLDHSVRHSRCNRFRAGVRSICGRLKAACMVAWSTNTCANTMSRARSSTGSTPNVGRWQTPDLPLHGPTISD